VDGMVGMPSTAITVFTGGRASEREPGPQV
jgi:hypothetical protein